MHGMRRFRLRRLWRVNCEALMRAAGQNLKRLLKKRGWGRRPWPEGAANALAEPPSPDHIYLHAPSLAGQAVACEEKLRVKCLLKPLGVWSMPLFSLHLLHTNVSPSSCEDSTVSRSLWLSSACWWLSRDIFSDKAGHRRLKVMLHFSLCIGSSIGVFQQAGVVMRTTPLTRTLTIC